MLGIQSSPKDESGVSAREAALATLLSIIPAQPQRRPIWRRQWHLLWNGRRGARGNLATGWQLRYMRFWSMGNKTALVPRGDRLNPRCFLLVSSSGRSIVKGKIILVNLYSTMCVNPGRKSVRNRISNWVIEKILQKNEKRSRNCYSLFI